MKRSETKQITRNINTHDNTVYFQTINNNDTKHINIKQKITTTNESLTKIIGISNSVTTTSLEPATLIDDNNNNEITDNETVENNFNPVNEIITDKNLLAFVFLSIENLEVSPNDFSEFEFFLKSSYEKNCYFLRYNPDESAKNYLRAIEILFEQDNTMTLIQNKMQEIFQLDTQDVMTQDAIVVFVPENN